MLLSSKTREEQEVRKSKVELAMVVGGGTVGAATSSVGLLEGGCREDLRLKRFMIEGERVGKEEIQTNPGEYKGYEGDVAGRVSIMSTMLCKVDSRHVS